MGFSNLNAEMHLDYNLLFSANFVNNAGYSTYPETVLDLAPRAAIMSTSGNMLTSGSIRISS